MSFSRIVCLPDLLRGKRGFPEAFFDLVRESILQGSGLDIGFSPGGKKPHSLSPQFDLVRFRALAGVDMESADQQAQWAASYHRIASGALDYLFTHLPPGCLVLSFEIPPWLVRACTERGVGFLDIRPSPLRFGRDLYIALRCSDAELFRRIGAHVVIEEEIRLEASLLGANVRLHQRRMEDEQNYRFDDLDGALLFVGQAPYDASLLAPDGRSLRCSDFAERLQQLSKGRRLLHKAHPFALAFAQEERPALERITGQPVIPCQLSAYQILSTHDDIELVGISSGMLQEAPWFDKRSHVLFQPFVPLVAAGELTGDTYQQLHFQAFLSPAFWHQVLAPERPAPRFVALPTLAHHHARETLDQWWDYSKVITWERSLPYETFVRNGGAVLMQRVSELENASAVHLPLRSEGIERLKDSKLGQAAYVLGAGPSLNELDISSLLGRESFWCNRAYELERLAPGLRFIPKYYLVSDPLIFEKYAEGIMAVQATTKLFRGDVYRLASLKYPGEVERQGIIPFQMKNSPCMDEGYFSDDPSLFIYRGYTVVLDAIQLAFYMGYERVYVGGVDLDYSQPYFFGETIQGNMPTQRARSAFMVAKQHFEKNGRVLAKITHSPNLPLDYVEISV